MWKLHTDNQKMPDGVPLMEEQQKNYNVKINIITLLEKCCEVEKLMRFPKEIEIFEKNLNVIDS